MAEDKIDIEEETVDTSGAVDLLTEEAERPETKALSRFTGVSAPQPSVQSIMGEGTYGPQAFSTYFPSMQNEIQHGTYTGSMIGSNPIYAPSALYPFGLMDARKQALARAADAKVAEQDKWANKMASLTAPKTKRTGVQPDITKEFYSGLSDLKKKVARENPGVDVNKAMLQDPETNEFLNVWRDVAAHEDDIVESTALFQKEAGSEGRAVFAPQQEIIKSIESGQILKRLRSTDPEVRRQAAEEFQQAKNLKAMRDPQKVMTEGVKAMEPDVQEYGASIDPQGIYDILTTTKKTGVKDERIRNYVTQVYNSEYGGMEKQTGFTYDDFAKGFASQFGTKVETQTQTASTKGGDGADDKFEEENIQKEQGSMLVGRTQKDAAGQPTNVQKTIPTQYGYTMKQPVKVKLAGSEEMYDLGDSQGGIIKTAPAGVKDATVQNFTNVPTVRMPGTKKFVPVDEDGLAKAKKNGWPTEWALYGVASFQGDEADEFKQKTILIPAEQVKNSVQKIKGGKKTGVDFEVMQTYTDKLNNPVHKIKNKEWSQAAVEKAAKASNMTIEEYVIEANK